MSKIDFNFGFYFPSKNHLENKEKTYLAVSREYTNDVFENPKFIGFIICRYWEDQNPITINEKEYLRTGGKILISKISSKTSAVKKAKEISKQTNEKIAVL